MTRRRCPAPGYATKEAALAAARKSAEADIKSGTVRAAAIRAYPCTCGKWHAGHIVLLA